MDATLDVWELAPESATPRRRTRRRSPSSCPQRLIDLYTYQGDVVLDPFMGSGTTAVAAVRTGRHYLGYDTDEGYAEAAHERVAAEVAAVARHAAAPARQGGGGGPRLLEAAGFTVEDASVQQAAPLRRRPAVDWIATDAHGRRVAGPGRRRQHGHRSGLRRSDVLFRTLGEASVLTTAGHRVLVLTTDLPGPRLRPLAAVRDARGVSLVDVVELGAAGARPSALPPTPPAGSPHRSATCSRAA